MWNAPALWTLEGGPIHRSLRIGSFVALLAAGLASPAYAVEQLDWCAPIVVRPDERFYTFSPPCTPWWPDDEIARRADFILDGFPRTSTSTIAPEASNCFGAKTMENSRAYHDRLRAAAAAYGRSLVFLYQARFDLVDRHGAGTAGFDANFLLDAARDWRATTDFFHRDRSASCACGCEWSDETGPLGQPPGTRLRDLIDASGGPDAYQRKVYYPSRTTTGGSQAGAPRRFFGPFAIADQTDPAYRAWRIGHMHDAIEVGGFDAVELNNKFSQYIPSEPSPVWGSATFPDVATYMNHDGAWTASPSGYGYPEYVQGWAALAADLEAAAIPYSLNLTPFVWSADTVYDDLSTPSVNEAEIIRGVARRARWVLITRSFQFSQAQMDAIVADIQSEGIATAVVYDLACGYGSPPGRPPTQLAAGFTMNPDAAVRNHYQATALRVDVFGVATGAWDADLWCHCPSPPCGAPSASVTGQTGTSWTPPLGLCDASYANVVGTRVPRVEVRRAGNTAAGARSVTLCTETCSNGRDDDRDGFADFPADLGCASPTDVDETDAALRCDDNVDNDGDGSIDHPADPQCTTPTSVREAQRPCGLGAELAPLAFLAAALRRGARVQRDRSRTRFQRPLR